MWLKVELALHHISQDAKGIYDWLIDFNGMSTRLGLFYTKMLRNCVHCTVIFTFWGLFLRVIFFSQLNRSFCPIVGSLTGITTPNQIGPGSKDNERVLYGSTELQNIHDTLLKGLTLLQRIQSAYSKLQWRSDSMRFLMGCHSSRKFGD